MINVTVLDMWDERIKAWNSSDLPIYEPGTCGFVRRDRTGPLRAKQDHVAAYYHHRLVSDDYFALSTCPFSALLFCYRAAGTGDGGPGQEPFLQYGGREARRGRGHHLRGESRAKRLRPLFMRSDSQRRSYLFVLFLSGTCAHDRPPSLLSANLDALFRLCLPCSRSTRPPRRMAWAPDTRLTSRTSSWPRG